MGGVEGFEMDEDDEMSIVGASERNQDRERLPHEELSSDSSKAAAAAGGVPCLEELHEQHRPNEGRGVAPGGEVEEETTTVYGAEESELHGRAAVATFPLESETILEEKAMESNLLATASDDVIRFAEQRPREQWVEEQEGAVTAGMMQEGMASRCVEVTNEGIASVEVKYGQVSESSTPVPFPSLLGASEEKVGSEILLPIDDAVENVDQKNQEHQLEEEGEGVRGEVMLEAVVSHCAEATEEGIAADGEMNDRSPSIALLPADDALDEDEQKHLQNFQAEEARGVTTEVMEEGVVKRCAEATEEVLAAMEVRYGQVTESPAPSSFPLCLGNHRKRRWAPQFFYLFWILWRGVRHRWTCRRTREEFPITIWKVCNSLSPQPQRHSHLVLGGCREVPSVYSLHVLDTNKAAVEEVEVRPSTVEAVKNAQVTHTMVEVVKDVEVTPITAEAVESVPIVAVTKEEEEVTPTKSEGLETETYLTTTRGEAVEAELKPIMVGIVEEVVAAATMTEAVEVEVKPRMLETLGPVVARTTIGEAVEEVKPSSMMTEPSDDLRPIPKIEEALGEKAVPQRMDVAKIKDEQTSQSIIDADVSMEDDMGLVAPMSAVDDGMEDVEQEEMAASMMGVPEDHEAALEDGSRRGGKKRGRPPKAQAGRVPTTKKKEEEDVCFICFDGGNLVVCDRRGCPKVYHPSCVNRDEAFFRSKGRWNCGKFCFHSWNGCIFLWTIVPASDGIAIT
ncbi:unnamed protein product [Spirodela intermedia]|uniref:Zinc finger PHD-type domain-containing protein n=1 Tax=Spirodela intermedia TaxID=51605 RepID=A0A7I8JUA5_SPIIN|nr:unnamed protein product [Spirodela intermedia]CAA6673674.1 unnamed protein product [Spirodela intermedia]